MWFSNKRKEEPRRRFDRDGSDMRDPLLRVNTRIVERRRMETIRNTGIVAALAVMLGLAAALWLTFRQMGAMLFAYNPRYALKTLDIRSDGKVLTPELVKDWTGVRPGMNVFEIDIRKLRTDFLKKAPVVKSIEISRRLPDALEIRISERLPVVRLETGLAVDKDSHVFHPGVPAQTLPRVTGYAGPALVPGTNAPPAMGRALELVDVCNRTAIGQEIRIATIDISSGDCVAFTLDSGERVRIAWEKTAQESSSEVLERKLRLLVRALRNSMERGKRIEWIDLSLAGDRMPAEEYDPNDPLDRRNGISPE